MSGIANNTQLLKILFSITLLVLVSTIIIEENSFLSFVSAGLNVFWYCIIFKHTTIRKTVYFRIMLIFLAMLLPGALFKSEHLPGASALITISILGIIITYIIRTFKKKKQVLLDWIKLSWLLATAITYLGTVEHFIPREYGIISNLLFLALIGMICLKPEQRLMMDYEKYYSNGDHKI